MFIFAICDVFEKLKSYLKMYCLQSDYITNLVYHRERNTIIGKTE